MTKTQSETTPEVRAEQELGRFLRLFRVLAYESGDPKETERADAALEGYERARKPVEGGVDGH